jgi:ribosomal protein L28
MARTCLISGKGTVSGHNVPRKGQAKKHGGVGQHIGVKTKRTFKTNMVTKKIFVPELGKSVKIRTLHPSAQERDQERSSPHAQKKWTEDQRS